MNALAAFDLNSLVVLLLLTSKMGTKWGFL